MRGRKERKPAQGRQQDERASDRSQPAISEAVARLLKTIGGRNDNRADKSKR
jgi:hypothetical protein